MKSFGAINRIWWMRAAWISADCFVTIGSPEIARADFADLAIYLVLIEEYKETGSCTLKINDINYLQICLSIPKNLLVHFPTQDSRRYMSHFKRG